MHTGLEEAPDGFERMAAYYAERARGGVGMIITGGIPPNERGRRGGQAVHAGRGRAAPADHHRRARGRPGREDLHADPAHGRAGAARRTAWRPRPVKSRIGPTRRRRWTRPASRSSWPTLPTAPRWPARPATTAWRSSARPATCCPPFWCRRPTCAPTLGRAVREPHALPGGGGAPGARRGGAGLHRDLPHFRDGHARRRAGLGRDRVAGAGGGSRRRQHPQHALLLARGPGAHHRHHGAARGVCVRSPAGCARWCACR
jgi:hypothetical protein